MIRKKRQRQRQWKWPLVTRREHERRVKAILLRLDAAIGVLVDEERAKEH